MRSNSTVFLYVISIFSKLHKLSHTVTLIGLREVANPKANCKSKISEDEIKGSVYLSGYLGQSGKFCSRLGIPSSSTAQGGGVTLRMNQR